jgi:hypothetical protein
LFGYKTEDSLDQVPVRIQDCHAMTLFDVTQDHIFLGCTLSRPGTADEMGVTSSYYRGYANLLGVSGVGTGSDPCTGMQVRVLDRQCFKTLYGDMAVFVNR